MKYYNGITQIILEITLNAKTENCKNGQHKKIKPNTKARHNTKHTMILKILVSMDNLMQQTKNTRGAVCPLCNLR